MAFTALYGTANSQYGNVIYGLGASHAYNLSVSSALILTETVKPGAVLLRTLTASLVLVETANPGIIHLEAVTSALVFVARATPGAILHRSVSTAVVYSGSALLIHPEVLSATLDLDSTVAISLVRRLVTTSSLALTNSVSSVGVHNLLASNNLLFAQSRSVPTGRGTYITLPAVICAVIPAFGRIVSEGCCTTESRGTTVVIQSANSIIVLPTPLLGDTEEQLGSLKINYAINGNSKITIKSSYLTKLSYTWELRRTKALELRQFLMGNDAAILTMTNWKGETWYCNVVNAPINLIAKSRWGESVSCGGNETVQVTLEFEGIRIAG